MRVLYATHPNPGEPAVAASGTVFIPDAEAQGDERSMVVWAHPTTGMREPVRAVARRRRRRLVRTGARPLPRCRPRRRRARLPRPRDRRDPPLPRRGERGPLGARCRARRRRAARGRSRQLVRSLGSLAGRPRGAVRSAASARLRARARPARAAVAPRGGAPAAAEPRPQRDRRQDPRLARRGLWASYYPQASLGQIVPAAAKPVLKGIAKRCIVSKVDYLADLPLAQTLKSFAVLTFSDLKRAPWSGLLELNTPKPRAQPVPLFIGQGTKDLVVRPRRPRRSSQALPSGPGRRPTRERGRRPASRRRRLGAGSGEVDRPAARGLGSAIELREAARARERRFGPRAPAPWSGPRGPWPRSC